MSHARKHLELDVLNELHVPEENEDIARVTETRGTNVMEVELPSGERKLCQMPTKFRKKIWIKRGEFLIVQPFKESLQKANKVYGLIKHVLYTPQIKNLKKLSKWPSVFDDKDKDTALDSSVPTPLELATQDERKTVDTPPTPSSALLQQKGKAKVQPTPTVKADAVPQEEEEEEEDDLDNDPLFMNPNHQVAADSSDEESEESEEEEEEDEGRE